MEHVVEKKCRANECKALSVVRINPEICKACGICQKNCPVGAIEGGEKEARHINQEKSIKCKTCVSKCPFKAIE